MNDYLIILLYFAVYYSADGQRDFGGFHLKNGWTRKYKRGDDGKLLPPPTTGIYGWYHKWRNLSYLEKFLGSATIFSFVTDRFHFMKWIQRYWMLLFISYLYDNYWLVPIGMVSNWVWFYLFYTEWRKRYEK